MVESSRIIPGQGNPPSQITGAQKKTGEGALFDLTKSEGDIEEIKQKRSERTRLSRTKGNKTENFPSLYVLNKDGEAEEEPIYRTVMVDGILFTLRLLAIA